MLERKTLRVLQDDASLSVAEVAERVGLSMSPCWRRIQRMREAGLITRTVALLDRRKVGFNTQIFTRR